MSAFLFAGVQVVGNSAEGEPQPDAALNLCAHGIVKYVPDATSRCGERFDLFLDLDLVVVPVLSGTAEEWGHDLHLWASMPGWTGCAEVWLHRVQLGTPRARDGGVELSGPAWGRSLHREMPPITLNAGSAPAWLFTALELAVREEPSPGQSSRA